MPTPPRLANAAEKPLVVDTAKAAAVFAHPRQRQVLFAFVGSDRSLGEVAASSAMPMNLLHYHAQRMLSAGLLRRRGKRVGAGRRVQLYRAAASSFFVPAELLRSSPDERLRRELRETLERQIAEGYLFSQDRAGRPRMRKVGGSDAAELWRVARLDEADAPKLAAHISRLIASYESRAGRRAKNYLLHFAVARRG